MYVRVRVCVCVRGEINAIDPYNGQFVGPHYGPCFMSPSWRVEVLCPYTCRPIYMTCETSGMLL